MFLCGCPYNMALDVFSPFRIRKRKERLWYHFLQDMEEKRLEKSNTATDICSLEHSISLISRKLLWCARRYMCKCVCERYEAIDSFQKRLINVFRLE